MRYQSYKEIILDELDQSLGAVTDEQVQQLVDAICHAERVFVVGVGRVLMMLQAFVKRLNHIGIHATYVGAVDEPAITENDLLIAGSGSGESIFPLEIMKKAKGFGATIAHIGSNEESSMAEYEDIFVRIPCGTKLRREDEIDSCQIMSSLFEQSLLLLEDAVALMIMNQRDMTDLQSLWRKHANLE